MEVAEFQRIVRLGLGRAVLHLREQDDKSPYHSVILDACLVNDVFDQQMNANRGQYLFDLIQATNDAEGFRKRLIIDLDEDPDEREHDVVPDMVRLFAQAGDDQSREALYAALDRNPISDPIGVAIVALDGLDGLLEVARRVGLLEIGDDLHPAVGDDALYESVWQFGEEPVWELLESIAVGDPAIATYISRQREYYSSPKSGIRTSRPSVRYEEFKAAVDAREAGKRPTTGFPIPMQWGRYADSADFVRAAEDFLKISDHQEVRLRQYVRVFARRQFPLDPQRLIQLMDHENDDIAGWAASALRHIPHPDVRELAFRLRNASNWRRRAWVGLLAHNYKPGDFEAIEASILAEEDEVALHSYGFGVENIYEQHQWPELAGALLLLYDRDPCASCRDRFIVRALHQLDALSPAIIEECRFDSDLDLREFVAALD